MHHPYKLHLLNALNTNDLERMEVIKGPEDSLYGADRQCHAAEQTEKTARIYPETILVTLRRVQVK